MPKLFASQRLLQSLRRVVAAAAVVTMAACGFAQSPATTPPADLGVRKRGVDWEAFLGPTGDGKSPERGLIVPWPVGGPKLVWQIPLGVGYGMPAVSRGRLFLFDRHKSRARLTCFNAATTEELWRFEYETDYQDLYGYNNGPRCAPVVDADRVYIFGAEGMLHCLSVVDGTLRWKVDTARTFGVVQNFFGVGSTPVVEGDLLIVHVGGSPPESSEAPPGALDFVKPNGTAVVAFDKLSGQVRYALGDDLASYSVPRIVSVGSRRRGFVWARYGLIAFDPQRGKQEFYFPWRAEILESVNASNPVIAGDRVFLSECYGPGSVLLKTRDDGCEVVWSDADLRREKRMRTHWNTAVEVDGFVYGSSGRHTNEAELRCVELATGHVKWSEPNLTRSSLTFVDGHFICLTEYGELLLLKVNPEKFDLVSRFTPLRPEGGADPTGLGPARLLSYPAWAAAIVSHGLMYVRGENRLACYEIIPD